MYMDTIVTEKKTSRFNLDGFNQFVKENESFLDSDIKVGIFAVGVMVRFLFDIQHANLSNTPFENKLRGYKLNPELLMQVYTEALDKIQKYQKNFYIYGDLREVISHYFVTKKQELVSLSNNELSFYFVAGLEMGRKFKNEKEENNQIPE
jgi:CRISPR-associated protein Csh1